ncbi:MAG: ThuA domain-containing protein [Terriglobia bacterium]
MPHTLSDLIHLMANRRQALRVLTASGAGWVLHPAFDLFAKNPTRKILFFSKSSGYEHNSIKRNGGELSPAEKVMIELGRTHGFDVVATKDGSIFTRENLRGFDAIFFYTTGDLTQSLTDKQPPMTVEGKVALLEAIRSGKGFLGTHSASDTFHSAGLEFETQPLERRDPYIQMLGGEFIRHGPQQEAAMRIVSPHFPGIENLGTEFKMKEEWYSLKNFAPDLHVILVQVTQGMEGTDYQRPDYPATWARKEGKGRVFYTSMGHREDVWTNPTFQSVLLGGIGWAVGNVKAAIPPNLSQVTPRAETIPPKPEKK